MERILVIGGGGFLGRHLVAKLRARSDTVVRIFGRRDHPDLRALGVEVVCGDVADLSALNLATQNVDAVFHVAAKVGIDGRRGDYQQTNVAGTQNVIAACRKSGARKLIYTGTPSVVFDNHAIAGGNEDLPYAKNCLTAYARSKIEAEKMVKAANGENLQTVALRPHLIWGPGDTNLIPRLIARAQTGKLAQIGDGKNLVSVSYVENVADAHLAALAQLGINPRVAGNAYFVNEPEPVNCWDFIRAILAALDLPPIRKKIPYRIAFALGAILEWGKIFLPHRESPLSRFLAMQLAKDHFFNVDRAITDLQWSPKISIAEGLRRLRESRAV